jgi:hypothetical protein
VEVDVALGPPPRNDATIYLSVAAEDEFDAELTALEIVCCHPRVYQPVASRITDWPE